MSIQDRLDELAKKHSGKHNISSIADFMIDEIKTITNEKIIIILTSIGWGMSMDVIYMTQEHFLEKFPYLRKFLHWENFFESSRKDYYLMYHDNEKWKWLKKKNANYLIKESMK